MHDKVIKGDLDKITKGGPVIGDSGKAQAQAAEEGRYRGSVDFIDARFSVGIEVCARYIVHKNPKCGHDEQPDHVVARRPHLYALLPFRIGPIEPLFSVQPKQHPRDKGCDSIGEEIVFGGPSPNLLCHRS